MDASGTVLTTVKSGVIPRLHARSRSPYAPCGVQRLAREPNGGRRRGGDTSPQDLTVDGQQIVDTVHPSIVLKKQFFLIVCASGLCSCNLPDVRIPPSGANLFNVLAVTPSACCSLATHSISYLSRGKAASFVEFFSFSHVRSLARAVWLMSAAGNSRRSRSTCLYSFFVAGRSVPGRFRVAEKAVPLRTHRAAPPIQVDRRDESLYAGSNIPTCSPIFPTRIRRHCISRRVLRPCRRGSEARCWYCNSSTRP